MDSIDLLNGILSRINVITYNDEAELDSILKLSEMYYRNMFGESCKYIPDLKSIRFHPNYYPADESRLRKSWDSGISRLTNLINTAIEEIQLFDKTREIGNKGSNQEEKDNGNSIFIVHGHDDAMKISVARTLEKLELNPIILHEKPNSGRTIIEKFTDYSDVSFAVVLLSPDDLAHGKNEKPENAKFRSRQNVILELGFFIGRLGRERVITLFKQEENFEMPSDYSGVLFTPFDLSNRWQFDIVKELKECGYNVDANKLL